MRSQGVGYCTAVKSLNLWCAVNSMQQHKIKGVLKQRLAAVHWAAGNKLQQSVTFHSLFFCELLYIVSQYIYQS